ncbi:arginine deiminase [Thermoanaerobacter thermohydrosulfuricus]|uniref:Arginine deiminase n=3 Tax=Thermoanaerobacter TaxID=1754 RepID=I9KTM7_9THEO|nr:MULTISPECIES: arginine deiminase [Thermoanaerobacter]EGD52995.1 Arginine deiminase [Thermoanaerobacter ethanolicus JW 200]HHY80653.1 arginine deiminase [Thermoanaerobacter sp.]AIS51309.1 arginine deiminase ArcA [Thermoanaerobacter kivui]EIW00319.1 arginine deiminase [Thermoanaerobacter siderophilus SR4]UZQ83115.1 arginine deiminase [Thermoanaerobacter sp. RKWS2]
MTKVVTAPRVNSEINKLKTTILHRPGKELERLTPQNLSELLFDDIPWVRRIQEEHDNFAKVLQQNEVQVLYLQNLLEEILKEEDVKEKFIEELLQVNGVTSPKINNYLKEFLKEKSSNEVAEIAIAGLALNEIKIKKSMMGLAEYIYQDNYFYIKPLPNLYFTRDPGAMIDGGLMISSMKTAARKPETLILKYIYKYHEIFRKNNIPWWYDDSYPHSIEGGDVLVLSEKVIAVGCSERTTPQAIEQLAHNLFEKGSSVERILVVQIPINRSYMHLDTVFTMVDTNRFVFYPGIKNELRVFSIIKEEKGFSIHQEKDLQTALKNALNLYTIDIIPTGGLNAITSAREQWNDSTNTLAIAPGVIVTYSRNEISNKIMEKEGIKVIPIEGSELSRGRGGPRCMTMPLLRE